jgi:o-succinylbenzoate---CoA ligase
MIVESWLTRAAALAPNRIALEDGERRCSYEKLHATAAAGAAELARHRVGAGERVAIALPPGLDFAIALHSCWLAGAAAVPVDMRLSEGEREAVTAGVALVISEPLRAPAPVAPLLEPAASAATPGRGRGRDGGRPAPGHHLDAVAAVIHTSGTTSAPRPIELTFGNLLWSALSSGVALGVDPHERWLCTLPLCHVGGLSILVRSAIHATTAVLHQRFEADRALAAIRDERITLVSVVATTLARLLDAGLQHPRSLRCALAGGGPVPATLLQRATAAGVPVSQTYGLTESCSQVSTVPLAALRDLGGAEIVHLGAGRPLFCMRVRIAAEDTATDAKAAPCESGEILVAGPPVAKGSISKDGWLHTGDLGMFDADGNLHVTGRKADTIISGGENVAPAEVEAALESHRQVAEAAVIGCSDPQWGEAVTAIVVPRDGERPGEQELQRHCAQRLAPYKVPKRVVLVDGPLPRTHSGKLLRRQLR